jgi:hypothetical protein
LYFPLPAPITPSAMTLEFLKSPPGNHLERLTRDREGAVQHSHQSAVARLLRLMALAS